MILNILIIDITQTDKLAFGLLEGSKSVSHKIYRGERQNLLLRLDQFLTAAKVSLEKLRGLALIEGGGSFSGVRQAAAILNTVAFVRRLPVAGFDHRKYSSREALLLEAARYFRRPRAVKYLTPIYGGEPNIRL